MCPLFNSLGMFRPWTWAMKDRMSLVVCSALKTWCCPLWMGGRWHLVVVLWRSWVRYWSNTSLEPSGIKHTPLFIVQINSDWEEHTRFVRHYLPEGIHLLYSSPYSSLSSSSSSSSRSSSFFSSRKLRRVWNDVVWTPERSDIWTLQERDSEI